MIHKINCKHCDGMGSCNLKPRIFFGVFKQPCIEYRTYDVECDIASRTLRPPPPPPLREPKIKRPQLSNLSNDFIIGDLLANLQALYDMPNDECVRESVKEVLIFYK